MIVRTPRIERDFTILPNRAIREPNLSYRARGVLAYLLSMPDNWRTNAVTLARRGREGRDAIRVAINELLAAGYMRRIKTKDDKGRFVTELHVYDTPQFTRVEQLGTMRGQTETPTTAFQASEIQASKEELMTKDVYIPLESVLGSDPELCGYCNGTGWIADGFAGQPMFCPDCHGDGIKRP